jgi:plasmid rolling circle replication initiator protein Rep
MHIKNMPTILLLANMIKITINPKDKHRFPHVHVLHAEKSALIDLKSFIVMQNNGFSEKTLKQVLTVI